MPKAEIVAKGRGVDEIKIKLHKDLEQIKKGLLRAGFAAEKKMKENIRPKRTGSTGKLARSITLENFGTIGGYFVGIGNITKMDKEAPYWAIVNYGGTPNFGGNYHFVPGSFNGSIFEYSPGAKTGKMLPSGIKGNVRPMNYIEKTASWVSNNLEKLLSKATR